MNSVSLIPFVVGLVGLDNCQKANPDLWKYGPEFHFKITLKGRFNNLTKNEINESNATMAMKCRPFSSSSLEISDGLQCMITNSEMKVFPIENINTENETKSHEKSEEYSSSLFPYGLTNQSFEILYAKHGIRDIVVQLPMNGQKEFMMRFISELLDYGFQGFEKSEDKFFDSALENSTHGECYAKFEITKNTKLHVTDWRSKCEKLKLEMLPYGSKIPSVELIKHRNVKNCTKKERDFAKIDAQLGKMERPLPPNFSILSSNLFIMTPQGFEVHGINKGFLFENDKHPCEESNSLFLETIDPATTEFKRLEKPVSTYY